VTLINKVDAGNFKRFQLSAYFVRSGFRKAALPPDTINALPATTPNT
jgi:hypothetical protein